MSDVLTKRLNSIVDSYGKDVSISIEDCRGNFIFRHNVSSEFPAASIIKLFLLDFSLLMEKNLDEKVEVDSLSPDDESMLKFFSGSTLTIRSLLSLMIDVSDNTATNFLIDRYGMQNIQKHIDANGMSATKLRRRMLDFEARSAGIDNTTSLNDVFALLKRHTAGCGQNDPQNHGSVFTDLMMHQHDRGRISLFLPDGIAGTKSGSLDDVYSDVGFIKSAGGLSYIGFLTRNEAVYDARLFIPELSLMFFDSYIRER